MTPASERGAVLAAWGFAALLILGAIVQAIRLNFDTAVSSVVVAAGVLYLTRRQA